MHFSRYLMEVTQVMLGRKLQKYSLMYQHPNQRRADKRVANSILFAHLLKEGTETKIGL